MGRGTVAAIALAGLAWPAVAFADKRIDAAPSNRYSTPEITMDQGERLTFRNEDLSSHDVTAEQKGEDSKPLFRSAVIERNEEAFVEGSQYLTTGHYPFFCSLHPNMKGTIHVTANGTPQPRPGAGGGGGGGGGGETPAADTTKPELGVKLFKRKMSKLRRKRALAASVTLNEGGHIVLRAIARPKPGGPLVTVARGQVHMTAAGTRRVALRLTKAGRKAVRKKELAVIVRARAADNAGNKARSVHGQTMGG
jgi:plastocyanin